MQFNWVIKTRNNVYYVPTVELLPSLRSKTGTSKTSNIVVFTEVEIHTDSTSDVPASSIYRDT